MSEHERRITRADVLSERDYAARRTELRKDYVARKKDRRVEVGPFATFYFENYESMWIQIHEMLHIEKGGEEQIAGELDVYNPLIPQGRELVATLMLEIADANRRDAVLKTLGGIEETVSMEVAGARIKAIPADYEDRTTPDGKTSSVHWLRFPFTPEQIAAFRGGEGRVVIEIAHSHYGHMAVVSPQVRAALAKDFA